MIKSDGTARMNPIILFNMKKECDRESIDLYMCDRRQPPDTQLVIEQATTVI